MNPHRLANGSFQFVFTNTNNISYSVYASSNLWDWVSNGPAFTVSPGLFQFTDPAAASLPQRFYELRAP